MTPVRRIGEQLMQDLGLPPDIMKFINYPTRFDSRETQKVLAGTGIEVPPLEDYAWKLWDYWERHLDPDLFRDRSLKGAAAGKVVMITGAGAGIGKAAALKIALAGAKVIVIDRDEESLSRVQQEVQSARWSSWATYLCDLTDFDADRSSDRESARRSRRGGHPGEQRRPLHPALHRAFLRPLSRFRADHAAELFRGPAAYSWTLAADAEQEARARDQYLVHRRVDQCPALLCLRGLEGSDGCVSHAAPHRSSRTMGSSLPPSACRWCARR